MQKLATLCPYLVCIAIFICDAASACLLLQLPSPDTSLVESRFLKPWKLPSSEWSPRSLTKLVINYTSKINYWDGSAFNDCFHTDKKLNLAIRGDRKIWFLLPSSVKSQPSWTEIALLSLFPSYAGPRPPGIVSKLTFGLPRKLKLGMGPLINPARPTS